MKKYVIWDKISNIITPSGKVFTPTEWVKEYPMAGVNGVKMVIGGGVINGSVLYEFTTMVEQFRQAGVDFSQCVTDQDYLDAIEEYENIRAQELKSMVSIEERTAAALEFIALNSLPNT